MQLMEITTATEEERSLLEPPPVVADQGTSPAYTVELPHEPHKTSTSHHFAQAPHRPVQALPGSRSNQYFETREPWMVSYEGAGIRGTGQVLGFSEAGWHIVGKAPVHAGARLALRVHRPDHSRTFCVPSATVQAVQGRAFVIRVQLPPAS